MQLEDWLDDLCVRFIINLPPEELVSVERICFQVEEAQWFYEDFIRPLDPSLPSLSLKAFSLRIFQHCPLFSTWTMHHYTSAFAEFLAYKQRVPVRGAIMLNEEMDEVVLVKGWKKGANWSFPRGKINKDENDLDCAVREVYEETGYDVKAAGLVKPVKDMKYIEVTMREQHMRLYVFRGVPKNTHFEPKTRKEISKIEWYKLTDLPTLKKKHTHHDAQEDNPALNANKFYMVAPFLHPLKKWIALQKKKENRFSSSHLAAPPLTADESATEGEPGPTTYLTHQPPVLSPQVPSSLPEVAPVQNQYPSQDPSLHLKELLKIGTVPPQSTHVPKADAAKSNALLSLLRNGSTVEMRASPQTPSEHMSVPPPISQTHLHPSTGPGVSVDPRRLPSSSPIQQASLPTQQRSLLDLFGNAKALNQTSQNVVVPSPSTVEPILQRPAQQPLAPYQRTGDPQFSRESVEEGRSHIIPPAHALPKLTHHTRALLGAFKVDPSSPVQALQPEPKKSSATLPPNRQALLDAFKAVTPTSKPEQARVAVTTAPTPSIPAVKAANQSLPANQPQSTMKAEPSNAASLLNLFKTQGEVLATKSPKFAESSQAPVELAAGPILSPKAQQDKSQPQLQTELLSALFRKDAPKRAPQAIRAGETAATIDGPLNQPHFESIAKSPSQISTDSMRRSPVPAHHRTLFDPKQPTPTKILQRPEESKHATTKSPRIVKANMTVTSPKQKTRVKPEKSFQPQILRRPQIPDNRESLTPSPTFLISPDDMRRQPSPLPPMMTASPVQTGLPPTSSPVPVDMVRRTSQQTETQKQNLLSLLTGQSGPLNTSKAPRQVLTPGAVSPLTQSQIMSPLGEDPPISTRSRMGSLASITSAGFVNDARAKVEKRQTTAGDKAFLLGYLGRIASQESQEGQAE